MIRLKTILPTWVIILCLLFAGHVKAQKSFQQEVAIGINGGASTSWLTLSPNVTQGVFIGFQGGATIRYISEKYFGLQLELNYAQRGFKRTFDNEDSRHYSYTRTFSYVELPFMTHITFGSKVARAFVNLGPQIGYMLGDKYTANFDIENPPTTQTQRHKELYAAPAHFKLNYGICGGLGGELHTRAGNFILEARYYFGLSDIFANKKKDYFATSSLQNVSLSISYLINILPKK